MKHLAIFLCTVPAMLAGPVYSVVDLGSMGGSSAAGYAVNNRGEAVGAANDIFGTVNAFRGSIDAAMPFARNAMAWDINDAGQIAGVQYNGGNAYATFWSNGGNQILGGAGSAALGINESGQVTGMTGDGHAFVTGANGVGVRDLGTMHGGDWTVGHSVNAGGDVAGYGMVGSNFRAFRWTEDQGYTALGTLGGRNSYGMAINDSGWVVGHSQNQSGYLHATLWTPLGVKDLGTLDHGLSSYAFDINEQGAVVGYSQIADGEFHAFLYQDGVMYDLNLLLGGQGDWLLNYAFGINDQGQIVGEGTYRGQMRAFRLDLRSVVSDGSNSSTVNGFVSGPVGLAGASAVPEPSSWGMLLAGLVLCSLGQMRRN